MSRTAYYINISGIGLEAIRFIRSRGNMGEDGCYSIKLTSGEEMLQVSYQPDSWLVSVDVVNGTEE